MAKRIYAVPGESLEQYALTRPPGAVEMAGPRPGPEYAAQSDGTWTVPSPEPVYAVPKDIWLARLTKPEKRRAVALSNTDDTVADLLVSLTAWSEIDVDEAETENLLLYMGGQGVFVDEMTGEDITAARVPELLEPWTP
ncbi:hypothetical protein [Desulfohalovibrio reitneri]|uniref:hypothetical protein n=1 Tax=Desulfohalovibrio reitneri TaxID=1307759 RepID=UPI0004A7218E|nr:hypothetical protein [Desulfohalovibrio reitneri]